MTAKPSRLPLKRILLAEDDDSMRGFLERALDKAGYEVVAFANGKDAYERLKEEPFTLLLTDIVMPQMDGIELARPRGRTRPRTEDHVHHRVRRRRPEHERAAHRRTPASCRSPSI